MKRLTKLFKQKLNYGFFYILLLFIIIWFIYTFTANKLYFFWYLRNVDNFALIVIPNINLYSLIFGK